MLSNSKKEFSTIDKKNSVDKRFEEDSTTNEKYSKLKFGDINSKNDTIDKPTNYIESTKKKGIFDINNSFDKENKENKNNENMEKNQKENNIGNPKSPFKKTFTFKDTYMKSNAKPCTRPRNEGSAHICTFIPAIS
jgi:hypothetical protein